jgi:hypothetical protein
MAVNDGSQVFQGLRNRPCAPKNQRVGSVRFRRQPDGRSHGFQSFLLSSPTPLLGNFSVVGS